MCGLFSALSFGPALHAEALNPGLEALQTRGPDGRGFWLNPAQQVYLGHVRLAIRDLSGGAQPLHSPDGRLHAVVNGELYNAEQLRQELNYDFQTQSDSELVLALYQRDGLDFVHALRGEFALVLWDGERLIAVRDRFGIKPLWYHRNAEALYLTSKARALFAAQILRPSLSLQALQESFSFQYMLPASSLYEGVRQLPPGHLLCATPDGNMRISRYWDQDYAPARELQTPRDAAEIVLEQLRDAVKERLCADAPLCTHLSGGLDSTSLMLLTQEGLSHRGPSRKKLESFCVSFPEHGDYDELQLARQSAAHAQVHLHQVDVRVEDMIREWSETLQLSEGLAINGHVVAKRLLNRHIHRAGFKVALSGEGADELLLGYGHFRQDLGLQNNNPLIQGLHLAPMQDLMQDLTQGRTQAAHGPELQIFQEAWGHVPAFLSAKAHLGRRVQQFFEHDSPLKNAQEDVAHEWVSQMTPTQFKDWHPVHRSAYLWQKSALVQYILNTIGDGTEMAHSIEGRVPFLDHLLFEKLRDWQPQIHFAPPGQGSLEKKLLRQALGERLPPALRKRPKHPFTAPPLSAFASWREFLWSQLSQNPTLPGLKLKAVQQRLQSLEKASALEHQLWDPALNLLLSANSFNNTGSMPLL